MASSFLSLILSLQLLCSRGEITSILASAPQPLVSHYQETIHISRLWWGMIDPELSAWFARLPHTTEKDADAPILWDWSWRGFWASIFDFQLTREDFTHAPSV